MHTAWGEKVQSYLVKLPEWMLRLLNQITITHGATSGEAARNGEEVITLLIEEAQAGGESLPRPELIEYDDDAADGASA